jgi:glutamate-1-semialdehyde aminotransferase/spore coat polysaccharide biosynthesis protein SpsF (cytidylyltransferase family)
MSDLRRRVVAVVQARMGSSRLPGKVLMPLAGTPALEFMLRRVRRARTVEAVVLATSTAPADDQVAALGERVGVAVHRGSEADVLDRVHRSAVDLGLGPGDVVVRLTGDCPFASPEVIDAVVGALLDDAGLAYVSNVSPPTFPDGLDCEALTFEALEVAWREAGEPHQREHVTPFVRERPDRFPARNVRSWLGERPPHRLTLDEPDDHRLLDEIAHAIGDDADLGTLYRFLRARPELAAINRRFRRNEGSIPAMRQAIAGRAPKPPIAESERWWRRREGLIPAGTMTLSKGPTQFVDGVAPKYLARGLGSHVWDVDGNEYLDYPLALGAITLGHRHPDVVRAIQHQLTESGTSFSLMHPLEVQLAERIREVVPCAEMVRFGKHGSDATSAAVRAGRAYTGRPMVARCGYHGWQDWAVDASYGIRARGVPDEVRALTVSFEYNDPDSLARLFDEHRGRIGTVILEPMTVTLPTDDFLARVRDIAHRNGAVLVFDEVVTGFRLAPGGAQEYFGVVPDLAALGKGIGNGLPISVVAGRAEVMEVFEEVFFSFTFGGETLSLTAALTVIDVMYRDGYWEHLTRLGRRISEGYRRLVEEFRLDQVTACVGLPQWSLLTFSDHAGTSGLVWKSLFQQEVLKRGILFNGNQHISLSHTDAEIERTLEAYREALGVVRFAVDNECAADLLEGRPIEPVFRPV